MPTRNEILRSLRYFTKVQHNDLGLLLDYTDQQAAEGQDGVNIAIDDLGSAIGQWQLNEASQAVPIVDRIAGRDGTLDAAVSFQNAGPGTGMFSIEFDGADQEITVTTDATLNAAYGASRSFSIECWYKSATVDPGVDQRLLFKRDGAPEDGAGWMLSVTTGNVAQVDMENTATAARQRTGTTNITDGLWHHIIVVRDHVNAELRLYVDGVLDVAALAVSAAESFESINNFVIGNNDANGIVGTDGELSNVVLYQAALSGTEIETLRTTVLRGGRGDDLGDHTMTQDLNTEGFQITNTPNAVGVSADSIVITPALTTGTGSVLNAGDVTIRGGSSTNVDDRQAGDVIIEGGTSASLAPDQRGGNVLIRSGGPYNNSYRSGDVTIYAKGGDSAGDINLELGEIGGLDSGRIVKDWDGLAKSIESHSGTTITKALQVNTGAAGTSYTMTGGTGLSGNAGGTITYTGGAGNGAGAGGAVDLNGGAGGVNAIGGPINLIAGAGGATGGGSAGKGGDINLTGGAAGAVASEGGYVVLVGGVGPAGGGTAGRVQITGGPGHNTPAVGNGGPVDITGGAGGTTGGGGGIVTVTGGAGDGGNAGGGVTVRGGAGDLGNAGGDLDLLGGTAGSSGPGGDVTITAANSNSGLGGGALDLNAGAGGPTGGGGSVTIDAGAGGATSGDGGDVVLTPGAQTSGEEGTIQMFGAMGFEHTAEGTISANHDFNVNTGLSFDVTHGAAATAEYGFTTFKNTNQIGVEATVEMTNGGQGTLTWGVEVEWAAGTAPTLTAAGKDLLKFYSRDGGTTWMGWLVGANFS